MTSAATLTDAATKPAADALAALGTSVDGLDQAVAAQRLQQYGPNAVSEHTARPWTVLWHQLRSPLLGLLLAAATASFFVGERTDAVIIGVIVGMSVGLGFFNEYRAELTAEALHSRISHTAVVTRNGRPDTVSVTQLVPGDVVALRLGDIVPADLRLIEVDNLECEESILTGESLPVSKQTEPVERPQGIAELSSCALMGTVVHSGAGRGVVVATAARTEFGHIAAGLNTRLSDTEFQDGLRRFSMMLVYVAGALTSSIFVVNVVLHRPVIDALLFSLAIAVGITPQLLPAVVSLSLAAGSRQMSRKRVLVKRLVCIEDLGDVDTLFTDKTGTLTEGRISFMRAVPVGAQRSRDVMLWGLLGCDVSTDGVTAIGGNALDVALWNSTAPPERPELAAYQRVAQRAFDHERRMASVLVHNGDGRQILVTKGAPESVLERCTDVTDEAHALLQKEFEAGHRVVAVATKPLSGRDSLTPDDENGLSLQGFLVFLDAPKPDAAEALKRLKDLGIQVRIITGDSAVVATRVCADLGLEGATATGAEVDAMDDAALAATIAKTAVFARVSPEQKARIVRVQRKTGGDVAYLGDGVNDALALHAADVGISVDTAADIAKDAADVILLEKDLHVLADGVAEGRRIFANTIKYVLMGTSSNFGNMFSAAGASIFLSFLPMLPSQILLNNLLYDTSQLTIPTDQVDEEQLQRPSHWDIGFIRRFMFVFGPISSLFDFSTFVIMLKVFHAGPDLFRSGWFVESLATQTLVIFAIRTRRVPFFRSMPSLPLALSATGVVVVGVSIPGSPLHGVLGFAPLPGGFFAALAGMAVVYLALIEAGKRVFFRQAIAERAARPVIERRPHRHHRRRAARFTIATRPGSQ